MKSTVEQLSPNQRQALVSFYETDTYKALKRLIELERLELAKDHVDVTEIGQIRYLSGQAAGLKKLVKTLRQLYIQQDKKKR